MGSSIGGCEDRVMQGELTPIRGGEWRPRRHLDFYQSIDSEFVRRELLRFVAERHDGHLRLVDHIWSEIYPQSTKLDGAIFHDASEKFLLNLEQNLDARRSETSLQPMIDSEVIPRRLGHLHLNRRMQRFLIDMRLCLRRIAFASSVTNEMRMDWQRWMHRTRILDSHLKDLFVNGIETPDGGRFGGKGFRSTWQEAVVACASALKRRIDMPPNEKNSADVIAPMIRDVGLALSMGQTPKEIFAAQMGKADSYMDGGHLGSGGRDLHIGEWEKGVLPPTAPLPIASATLTGVALAASLLEVRRFHLAPVGEGCSSSGEFWEAMNLAGARGLPISFMIQNNQIALDTFVTGQSGVETFGDKAVAMGFPGWTIDGSDPVQFYSSTAVAREFALAGGGSTLIHVETMRGCGHAHHHDDLYLGSPSGNPPGYVDQDLISYWESKDPISTHRQILIEQGIEEFEIEKMEEEETALVNAARIEMENMDWPNPETVTRGITSLHDAESQSSRLQRIRNQSMAPIEGPVEIGVSTMKFSEERSAWTMARAIQNGMVSIAERYGRSTVFMGEDMEVAGAFGMNIPLKSAGHSDLLLDMPLSEAAIIHSATGAALGGMRPMAEIQFGGFAALAMNALINNAAQLRWRWGADVPLTVRIPLGAKTRSCPFHANMIESWMTNDPGLVILFPSCPQDAYDLLIEGASLPDPVIFLEHIGMYGLRGGLTGWGDSINQDVDTDSVNQRIDSGEKVAEIGRAKIIRGGRDATIVTWGAMVHIARHAAEIVAKDDIEIEIIDLRTLIPFDAETCVASVQRTGRMMILQEAQWSGGFGHTVSSRILEEAFWALESPPVVVGALDTPVPFSPPLEDYTIPDVNLVVEHLRLLLNG
ncbi:MAG: hypothetical protein CMB31_03385 [Euryarchaeota archaeon]|nr:hypothetical protein [Euryarchaeota archaeon]